MCIVNLIEKLLISMGNKNGCCVHTSPPVRRKDTVNQNDEHGSHLSPGNLQHISEREPEDWDTDPSLHPKAKTIFLERSKLESMLCALTFSKLPISVVPAVN